MDVTSRQKSASKKKKNDPSPHLLERKDELSQQQSYCG